MDEDEEDTDQEDRRDHDGTNARPQLLLQLARRRRDGEHGVHARPGRDLKARLRQVDRQQAAQPPRRVRWRQARRRGVEDQLPAVVLVQDDLAPEEVGVQVVEDLLGRGQVADDQRVEQ